MGHISKWCLRKVLKCRRKKPLGLFVKAVSVAHRCQTPVKAEFFLSIQQSSFNIKRSEVLKSSGSHEEHDTNTLWAKEVKQFSSSVVIACSISRYPDFVARGHSHQPFGISFTVPDDISLVEGRNLFSSAAFYVFLSMLFSLPGPSCLSGDLPSDSQSCFIIVLWKCLYNSCDMVILDSC